MKDAEESKKNDKNNRKSSGDVAGTGEKKEHSCVESADINQRDPEACKNMESMANSFKTNMVEFGSSPTQVISKDNISILRESISRTSKPPNQLFSKDTVFKLDSGKQSVMSVTTLNRPRKEGCQEREKGVSQIQIVLGMSKGHIEEQENRKQTTVDNSDSKETDRVASNNNAGSDTKNYKNVLKKQAPFASHEIVNEQSIIPAATQVLPDETEDGETIYRLNNYTTNDKAKRDIKKLDEEEARQINGASFLTLGQLNSILDKTHLSKPSLLSSKTAISTFEENFIPTKGPQYDLSEDINGIQQHSDSNMPPSSQNKFSKNALYAQNTHEVGSTLYPDQEASYMVKRTGFIPFRSRLLRPKDIPKSDDVCASAISTNLLKPRDFSELLEKRKNTNTFKSKIIKPKDICKIVHLSSVASNSKLVAPKDFRKILKENYAIKPEINYTNVPYNILKKSKNSPTPSFNNTISSCCNEILGGNICADTLSSTTKKDTNNNLKCFYELNAQLPTNNTISKNPDKPIVFSKTDAFINAFGKALMKNKSLFTFTNQNGNEEKFTIERYSSVSEIVEPSNEMLIYELDDQNDCIKLKQLNYFIKNCPTPISMVKESQKNPKGEDRTNITEVDTNSTPDDMEISITKIEDTINVNSNACSCSNMDVNLSPHGPSRTTLPDNDNSQANDTNGNKEKARTKTEKSRSKSSKEHSKINEDLSKSNEEQTKSSEEHNKSSEEILKSSESSSKSSEETTKDRKKISSKSKESVKTSSKISVKSKESVVESKKSSSKIKEHVSSTSKAPMKCQEGSDITEETVIARNEGSQVKTENTIKVTSTSNVKSKELASQSEDPKKSEAACVLQKEEQLPKVDESIKAATSGLTTEGQLSSSENTTKEANNSLAGTEEQIIKDEESIKASKNTMEKDKEQSAICENKTDSTLNASAIAECSVKTNKDAATVSKEQVSINIDGSTKTNKTILIEKEGHSAKSEKSCANIEHSLPVSDNIKTHQEQSLICDNLVKNGPLEESINNEQVGEDNKAKNSYVTINEESTYNNVITIVVITKEASSVESTESSTNTMATSEETNVSKIKVKQQRRKRSGGSDIDHGDKRIILKLLSKDKLHKDEQDKLIKSLQRSFNKISKKGKINNLVDLFKKIDEEGIVLEEKVQINRTPENESSAENNTTEQIGYIYKLEKYEAIHKPRQQKSKAPAVGNNVAIDKSTDEEKDNGVKSNSPLEIHNNEEKADNVLQSTKSAASIEESIGIENPPSKVCNAPSKSKCSQTYEQPTCSMDNSQASALNVVNNLMPEKCPAINSSPTDNKEQDASIVKTHTGQKEDSQEYCNISSLENNDINIDEPSLPTPNTITPSDNTGEQALEQTEATKDTLQIDSSVENDAEEWSDDDDLISPPISLPLKSNVASKTPKPDILSSSTNSIHKPDSNNNSVFARIKAETENRIASNSISSQSKASSMSNKRIISNKDAGRSSTNTPDNVNHQDSNSNTRVNCDSSATIECNPNKLVGSKTAPNVTANIPCNSSSHNNTIRSEQPYPNANANNQLYDANNKARTSITPDTPSKNSTALENTTTNLSKQTNGTSSFSYKNNDINITTNRSVKSLISEANENSTCAIDNFLDSLTPPPQVSNSSAIKHPSNNIRQTLIKQKGKISASSSESFLFDSTSKESSQIDNGIKAKPQKSASFILPLRPTANIISTEVSDILDKMSPDNNSNLDNTVVLESQEPIFILNSYPMNKTTKNVEKVILNYENKGKQESNPSELNENVVIHITIPDSSGFEVVLHKNKEQLTLDGSCITEEQVDARIELPEYEVESCPSNTDASSMVESVKEEKTTPVKSGRHVRSMVELLEKKIKEN